MEERVDVAVVGWRIWVRVGVVWGGERSRLRVWGGGGGYGVEERGGGGGFKYLKLITQFSLVCGYNKLSIYRICRHESQFIKKVVDTILDRLFALNSCVDECLVGMRTRFQGLKSLLDIGSGCVRMVGIWGVGGGGKTTLATSVYMEMSQHFQGHCILENVREDTSKHGLKKLQENILSSLFKKEVNVYSLIEGKHKMKSMLCCRKVLVVLDDVDELGQLEALAGKHNWFGSGSRIIITTRDEHLLRTHRVDHVYPIALLSNDDATQLFKRHAYNEKEPIEDYDKFSLRAVSYASGHPLSLKVLGSFLYDKNKNEWISALEKLKDIPNPNVMNIIKTSYDGLESYEKELFLDIACFFRRWNADRVVQILEASGFHPKIGMKVLIQKALITIVDDIIDMHDVLEEMGHYIVRGEHPNNPEKHSRLWIDKEIKELCFKDERMEYDKTEAIIYAGEDGTSCLCKIVSKMKKLRLLCVTTLDDLENVEGTNFLSNELQYISWFNYPASPFPDNFQPMKLAVLELSYNKQKELWKGYKVIHYSFLLKVFLAFFLTMENFIHKHNHIQHLKFFSLL
ncbi:TMV resistance protein N-like [Helianthus annuus]|uniref:TMV resistance protein N-like n=1 Tax=Helianthus annuus TaxID=4232 RepID=UPI00165340F2|nr:TMV resistance protein N-like [Helianthus annuus]